jgi:Flp pilus assembly protein TadG
MAIDTLRSQLSQQLTRFGRDQRAMSAIEFAMVLPVMLTFYLGTAEVSDAVGIDRKVTLTAHTAADLVSQVSSINNADMNNLLSASTAVIAPYNATPLSVTVSLITIDANGSAKITWSDSRNGSARSVGSSVSLPTALKVPSTSLVWSEVSYAYKPAIGYVITGTISLKDQLYMRPRLSTTVTRVNS